MNAKPRAFLILIAIFVAGVATGLLVPWRVLSARHDRPQGPRPKMVRILERIDHALELTPEQRPEVEAIVRASSETLDRLRRESFKAGAAEIETMNAKIQALLTPEQREKFAELQREQRERVRRFEREHSGPHRDGAGSPRAPRPPAEEQPPEGTPDGPPPQE